MATWLWIVGFLGTLSLGVLLGLFLGGLACASDQKREEEKRAEAVAALVEARPFVYLWLRTASSRRDRESSKEMEAKRVVSFAVLDALRALDKIDEAEVEEAVAAGRAG